MDLSDFLHSVRKREVISFPVYNATISGDLTIEIEDPRHKEMSELYTVTVTTYNNQVHLVPCRVFNDRGNS